MSHLTTNELLTLIGTLPPNLERSEYVYELVTRHGMAQMDIARESQLTAGMVKSDVRRWVREMGAAWPSECAPVSADQGACEASGEDATARTVSHESEPRASVRNAPRVMLKAAVVDIECTDFGTEGYAGLLICVSILPLDSDTVTTYKLDFDAHGDDRTLVAEVMSALAQYDILIGHNLAAFDLNWLHSRWFFHDARGSEVGDWRRWLYMDTYQSMKTTALKTRKGLGNLGDFFGLVGVKTSIFRTSWNNVRSPYRQEFEETLDQIVYHCEQDVILNRNLFDIMWDDAMSRNANPLKMSKWGYIPGNQRRDSVREAAA